MSSNEKLAKELNDFLLDYFKGKENTYHSPYFIGDICAAIESYSEVDTGELLKIAANFWDM